MSNRVANVLTVLLLLELLAGLVATGLAFKAAGDAQQATRLAVAVSTSTSAPAAAPTASTGASGQAVQAVVPQTADTAVIGTWQAPRLPVIGLRMTPDVSLLVLAVVSGFVGALVHALTGLATRRGLGKQDAAFATWYIVAPITGAALSMLFFAALHVGLLSTGASGETALNLYGVVALGGVAGLLARRVTGMLAGVLGDTSKPTPQTPSTAADRTGTSSFRDASTR